MTIQIGQPAPDFKADAWVRGANGPRMVALSEYRGKWVVLFFYPRDFTFICPTEIASFGALQPGFEREDAVVIGASTDSFFTHKAWFESDPRLQGIDFPVLADTSQEVSREFNVLLDDGAALRGTFIMDPEGIMRHITVNELDVGRNVDETLRVLQALRMGELCPVGWRPGQPTLSSYDEWLAKALPRLSREVLVKMTQELQTVTFSAGEIVFEQGSAADRFYIIESGEVQVICRNEGREQNILATLQSGDFFGEIGLLTEARRMAAVRAKTDLKLLTLDFETFKKVVVDSQETTMDFAEIVRERLAQAWR